MVKHLKIFKSVCKEQSKSYNLTPIYIHLLSNVLYSLIIYDVISINNFCNYFYVIKNISSLLGLFL